MQPSPQRIGDLREYPILYVDDEPENLRIFELTFRRQFEIFTALSGEEGLDIINTKPVSLVLSDHRMPGMTGVEFLSRVAEIDPHTVRIMVTAYGDAETLQGAVNSGSIYHFISKPWEPEDVRATLVRGIEAYALDRERAQLLQEMTVLNRVSSVLGKELDLERLLEVLVRTLRIDLGYDGSGVLVRDPETGDLEWAKVVAARDDIDSRLESMRFTRRNARSFLEDLEDGRSLTLRNGNLMDYPEGVRQWVTEVAAEEIVVTPLFGKRGLIGAITLDNRRGGRRFGAADVTMIEGLSSQASIALENARLVEDLRRSHAALRDADRRDALGTVVDSLAREIEAPLGAIESHLARASGKRGSDGDASWSEACAATRDALGRIRSVSDTLQKLARGDAEAPRFEAIDPAEVVAEAVASVVRDAESAGVALRHGIGRNPTKIVAVRAQLEQLMSSLVGHALEVTPADGVVDVASDGLPEGGVQIEVCHSGAGIPDEELERIFDPFQSSRLGDARALGLVASHRIVSDHKGSLEVSAREGGGACFRVRLPADASA